MRVRIRTGWRKQPSAAPEKPSFAELPPRRVKGAVSFASSLGMHLTTVWLVGSMVQAVNQRRMMIHETHLVRALEMPVTDTLQAPRFLAGRKSAGLASPATQKSADSPPRAKTAEAEPSVQSAGESPMPTVRQGKRFMFPVEIAHTQDKQVLVQLESPPDIKLKSRIALPEVMLWQLPAPLKAKPQVMAAPEQAPQVHERETPAVQPQLTARNREQDLANYRHAASPPVPDPLLPLPIANTTPIRLLDAIKGSSLPISTRPPAAVPEAVHVISVPDLPVPEAHMVALPPGSQAPLPGAPAGSSSGGGPGTTGSETQPNAAKESQRRGVAGGASESESASGSGTAAGATGITPGISLRSGGARPGSADSGSGHASAGVGNANTGASASIGPPPPGTTRIDRPRDGKYSVVVLGNSNLDAYPEAAGILSGKLVYSVYVRAGGHKEWILQYCLPRAVEQAVKLRGSAVPIQAPYPYVIYYPKLTPQNDPDYLIIHGVISPAGHFEQLSALGDIDAASKELLLGALQHWEFRPASRDGEPNAVEIALIIPREPI